jgi:probable F420-dependent oxidoreductase
MAGATEQLRLGTCVTNPATREPSVTASTLAVLNEVSGGRMDLGIGRGDSARRVLGKPPTTMATLEEAIRVIRDLVEGRAVEYEGTELRLPWTGTWKLPVWVAGYGPMALAMIGRVADGVILQLADLDIAEWMIKTVRDAAEKVGRDPASVKFCVAAPMYIGDDWEHMRDQCRWFGGMVGNHVADIVAKYGENSSVPKALTDYIKARDGYDYNEHGRSGNTHTAFVPDDIVDRFCLLGNASDHIAKLTALKELGVDQFAGYLQHDNKEETLRVYGEAVMPAMREHIVAKE